MNNPLKIQIKCPHFLLAVSETIQKTHRLTATVPYNTVVCIHEFKDEKEANDWKDKLEKLKENNLLELVLKDTGYPGKQSQIESLNGVFSKILTVEDHE